ncbi:hypothetical protein [Paraliomyxa miuraensis]|uniref:hypothetical protein n=1 Tax=Paraliomyxa miuraensis TaxID=376150 RepID=UPI00225B1E33|nr:hypothetical protein [Paraliomyxa miuraensis]MCX4241157.1 hypothetical protein [Paraliomyxa miuraensis]
MPGSSDDDPKPSPEPLAQAAHAIVREPGAPLPSTSPTETTVKVPMPPKLPEEDNVRAQSPTSTGDADEVEEVEALDEEVEVEGPGLDVKALVHELEVASYDVPVARSEMPTVPETAAKPRREVKPRRDDPPAVAGEVAISEDGPVGLFDSPPPSASRDRPRRSRPVDPNRRDDPPSVAGEVAVQSSSEEPEVPRSADVVVAPMSSSGPQPVLAPPAPQPMVAASGSHPIYVGQPTTSPTMTSSGSHPVLGMNQSGAVPTMGARVSSDPTGFMVSGPHARTRSNPSQTSARDNILLWILAGALVVLALGVVVVMVALMK